MNLFKHKVSHMSRPTEFKESKNTTDELKDKFKAFTLKNIKNIGNYVKPLTIDLYKTYSESMMKEEAAFQIAALHNDNKKEVQTKDWMP